MSRFLNIKPVTSEGFHKFLLLLLWPQLFKRWITLFAGQLHYPLESAIGIAMVFSQFTGRSSPPNALIQFSNLEFSNQCDHQLSSSTLFILDQLELVRLLAFTASVLSLTHPPPPHSRTKDGHSTKITLEALRFCFFFHCFCGYRRSATC